jgi:hypothetical protein
MSTSETSQSTHDQVNGNFQGLRLEVGRAKGRPKRMSDKFGTLEGKEESMYVCGPHTNRHALFISK